MRVVLWSVLFAAIGGLTFPLAALGYRCTQTSEEQGAPSLSWAERSIEYVLHADGTETISGDEEFSVLRDSFLAWTRADDVFSSETSCRTTNGVESTNLSFRESTLDNTSTFVGYDYLRPVEENQNLLIFYDQNWPHPGTGQSTVALTTVSYSESTGVIFDADIEFNSEGFNFSADGLGAGMDLMNAAVHEIGHFLGLAHSSVSLSTMESHATNNETHKRDLACDDARAITFKYPASQTNGYCDADESCTTACFSPEPETHQLEIQMEGCMGIRHRMPTTLLMLFLVGCWRLRRRLALLPRNGIV